MSAIPMVAVEDLSGRWYDVRQQKLKWKLIVSFNDLFSSW